MEKLNEAEKLLKQAIASDDMNFDAKISLAQLYFNQHYFDETEILLNLLSDNQSQPSQNQTIQFLQLMSELLFHKGEFGAAIQTITQTIESPDITTKQLIDSQFIYSRFINEQGDQQKSIDIFIVVNNTMPLAYCH